jgi:outer membrane protein assembly factor BamB
VPQPSSLAIALAVTAVVAAWSPAQVVVLPGAPALVTTRANGPTQTAGDDPGVVVELFENPNLDRYLRNAQAFLAREDFTAAIKVLQDVIEGRTVEVVVSGDDPAAPEPTTAVEPESSRPPSPAPRTSARVPAPVTGAASAGAPRAMRPAERDARHAVYSQDSRLYRPVYRLCHELLARMPLVALEIYRTKFEVEAQELLQAALAEGSLPALEQVVNRFFITQPAGRAMTLLADRLMGEGRHRAAVQVLRDLLEIYPADQRKRLGISDVWCHFKIALCLRLAGELESAAAALAAMATRFPDESLRVGGELFAVKDLPAAPWFGVELRSRREVGALPQLAADHCLAAPTAALVPVWQYRFRNPDPYKDPKPAKTERHIFFDGGSGTSMPFAGRYGPGTRVGFVAYPAGPNEPPHALFLEHYRLRDCDAATGVMVAQGDGNDEPPPAKENHPRVRIASSDFALLRPVEDEARRYVVCGHPKATTNSNDALKSSELVAYGRGDGMRSWTTNQWLEGDSGLREVTFLAAPTVFGERLLLPALRRGFYSLECLDRRTGQPQWHTPIHGGGSPFFKAPGCQVTVVGGIAYVVTNAGCLAAVDAFAGDLRWIRRYERVDPIRPPARPKRVQTDDNMGGFGVQFLQQELTGFWPNDLLHHQGTVICAPVDGSLVLAVDGATGELVWLIDGMSSYSARLFGKLRMLVGIAGDNLFALSDTHLVAIDCNGGLIKWSRELPVWNGSKQTGRGRGCILGDQVVVPGQRELLVFDAAGQAPMRRLPVPGFDTSREPLIGPFHVTAQGPWLALGYPGGVEVFSVVESLRQLAQQTEAPLRRAHYLELAGDAAGAEAVLRTANAPGAPPAVAKQLLSLVRERASQQAQAGAVAAAWAALDELDPVLTDRDVRLTWHLARLELCQQIGDLAAHEREQQRLYDSLEGRR